MGDEKHTTRFKVEALLVRVQWKNGQVEFFLRDIFHTLVEPAFGALIHSHRPATVEELAELRPPSWRRAAAFT
jgi:hypothetical protein